MTLFEDVLSREGYAFDTYYLQTDKNIIGIDEVGRGPLAGPVVSAAVILDYQNPMRGLNDSKKLSEKQREELVPLIFKHALKVGVGMSFPDEIDKVNILQATILSMKKAVKITGVSSGILLIDGLSFDLPGFRPVKIIKGDTKSPAIMAASIVAKVVRDRLMVHYGKHFPGYGFEKHKGYGTAAHMKAIAEKGISPIHRKTFEPIKGMLA